MQINRILLGLAVAFGVLAASAAAAPIIGAEPEKGSDKWIVDDAEVIMVFNFKAMTKSKLMSEGVVADFIKKAVESEKAKEAIDKLGLDPMKDLDSVIFSGAGLTKKEKLQRLVL